MYQNKKKIPHVTSLVNIEKILNRPITQFNNNEKVNVTID